MTHTKLEPTRCFFRSPRLVGVGLFLSIATAASSANAVPLTVDTARWIWTRPDAATVADPGRVLFRYTFTLEQKPEAATLIITCDNGFDLFINGRISRRRNDWQTPVESTIAPLLKKGRNVIAVRAHNDGKSPAGLFVSCKFEAGGKRIDISSSKRWRWSVKAPKGWNKPDFDDSRWKPAFELGDVNAAPWRLHDKLNRLVPSLMSTPDPERERKQFNVTDGFEVNLFAANPALVKPIQMNFDADGRLWIASSEVYPQIKPGQVANDKVIVLEDTDQDGRADKTHIFADGLFIPTGIEPDGNGGAYVANSTEMVHLVDTDGDGRADKKTVMLSGFGTEDTHHIIHTFRWGPDGMLYFNQSIYIHSHVETPYGPRRLLGGGIWHYRPGTGQLGVFIRGLVNGWGHHFDYWGQSFGTDGAGGEGINYFVPGATFVASPGARRYLHGLNPGHPKYCGAQIVSGRHLPEDWQGNILTNDFRANRVVRFALSEDGSGYSAKQLPDVMTSTDVAFRPIDIKMGPDGAIYIADWYNPIIQHGEVDFRDPRRDHTHGRIWRLTAKGRPVLKRPELTAASNEELLEFLKAPEGWTRHFAKRVISQRGKAMLPALAKWIDDLAPEDEFDEPDEQTEHALLEALWCYQTLDVVQSDLLKRLLRSDDHRVRAAATRVLHHWRDRVENAVGLLAVQINDDHPRVRLEAIHALSHVPSAHAVELAMLALDKPVDRFLDYALWKAANDLKPYWLPELKAGRLTFDGNARRMAFALQAVDSPEVVKPLLALLRSGKIPTDRRESILTLVAGLGDAEDLDFLFDLTLSSETSNVTRSGILSALRRAAEQRNVKPSSELGRIETLFTAAPVVSRAALRLAGAWHLEALRDRFAALAVESNTPDRTRQAAVDALVSLGGKASIDLLNRLANGKQPAGVRQIALIGLVPLDTKLAAAKAVEMLSSDKLTVDPTPVLAAFLQRQSGPQRLAAALRGKTLPTDVAKIALRAARTAAVESPALVEAVSKAGGLTATAGPKILTPQQLKKTVADVLRLGDPARGQAVFRRKDLGCMKCHAIGGAGGQVGPDLTSIGASAHTDYLVESVYNPGKAIKEGYHAVVVRTKDGRIFSGIKVRQTDKTLVLRDAQDEDVALPITAIAEQKPAGSIMPVGLADTLTSTEFLDLVRFLSQLGKPGKYALTKDPLVRRWRVLDPVPPTWLEIARDQPLPADDEDESLFWTPAYSRVDGTLPLDDLPKTANRPVAFVSFLLDGAKPGKVRLVLNDPTGLTLWNDRQPYPVANHVDLDTAVGLHTITIRIDTAKRTQPLRIGLAEVPGSTGQAQFVIGK